MDQVYDGIWSLAPCWMTEEQGNFHIRAEEYDPIRLEGFTAEGCRIGLGKLVKHWLR